MQNLVQNGKYQVHKILHTSEGYQALVCINVEAQDYYAPVLLNIYEKSEYIRAYLRLFYELDKKFHSDFLELMTHSQGISAAFHYYEGTPLIAYCKQIERKELEEKIQVVERVFEALLLTESLDNRLLGSIYRMDNLVVQEKDNKIRINYILRPDLEYEEHLRSKEISSLLECLFKPGRYTPREIEKYMQEIKENQYKNTVSMYAKLREIKEDILKEYKLLKEESFFSYAKRVLKEKLKKKSKKTN